MYVSGSITALAAVSHRRNVHIFGRCTIGRKGRNGFLNPLACIDLEPYLSHKIVGGCVSVKEFRCVQRSDVVEGP